MAVERDDPAADHASSLELLWGTRERSNRGPKPALSIERIARTAIEIADAEGFGAISMQRVAGELDFTKMSLYRYVAGKAELIAVMVEAAVGEPPDLMVVPGGWRPRLEEWAHQMRATWQRHPWLPGATVGDRATGPREIGWTESAVAALADSGLDGRERMDAVFLVSGHIRNTHSVTMAGTQPWTTDRRLRPIITQRLREHGDRFQALIEATSSAEPSSDNGFDFGLQRILDGLETFIARRKG